MSAIVPCKRNKRHHHDLRIELRSSVTRVPKQEWDRCIGGGSVFLSRAYLRALELSGEAQCCAMFWQQDRLVGVAAFQVSEFQGAPLKSYLNMKCSLVEKMLSPLGFLRNNVSTKMIVCGSPYSAGEHGFHFSSDISAACQGAALAQAATLARGFMNVGDSVGGVLLKEFFPASESMVDSLEQFRFTALPTEPSMILAVDDDWHCFDDYLGSLASKYRIKAKRAMSLSSRLQERELRLEDIAAYRDRINDLYEAVVGRAHNKLGGMNTSSLLQLRQQLGDELVLKGYFLGGELVGFLMGFVGGDTLHAGFVGIDYALNKSHAIYSRMLYDYLRVAISRNLKAVNYGRTAAEIKSTLGAVPVEMSCCVQFGNHAINTVLPMISGKLQLPAFPLRKPFKKDWYTGGEPALIAALQSANLRAAQGAS